MKHTTLNPEYTKPYYRKLQPQVQQDERKHHQYNTEFRKTSSDHYVSTTKPYIKNKESKYPHHQTKETGPQQFTSVTEESSYEYYGEPGREREIIYDGPIKTSHLNPPHHETSSHDAPHPSIEVDKKERSYSTPSPQIPHIRSDLAHESQPSHHKTSPHNAPNPSSNEGKNPSLFYPTPASHIPYSSSDEKHKSEPSYTDGAQSSSVTHKEEYFYPKPSLQNVPYSTTIRAPTYPDQPQVIQHHSSEAEHKSLGSYATPAHDAAHSHSSVHKPKPSYSNTSPHSIPYPNSDTTHVQHSSSDVGQSHPKTPYDVPNPKYEPPYSESPPHNVPYLSETHPTEQSYLNIPHHNLNSSPQREHQKTPSHDHPSSSTHVKYNTEPPYVSPSTSPSYSHNPNYNSKTYYEATPPYKFNSHNIPETTSYGYDQPSTRPSEQHYNLQSHGSNPPREPEQSDHVEHQRESTHYSASLHPNPHSAPVPTFVEHETQPVLTNPSHGEDSHNTQHSSSHIRHQDEYQYRSSLYDTTHGPPQQSSYAESPRNLPNPSSQKEVPSYISPVQNKANDHYHNSKTEYERESSLNSQSHHQNFTYPNSHSEYSTESSHSLSISPYKAPYPSSSIELPRRTSYPSSNADHPEVPPPISSSHSGHTYQESSHVEHQTESSRDFPSYSTTSNTAPYPSSHIEPPRREPYPNSNVQHQQIPSHSKPSYSADSSYTEHHTEPSYNTALLSTSHLPNYSAEHYTESSHPLPSYSTTTLYHSSHTEHHTKSSYPSPSYSTTPHNAPYPSSKAEHQTKPSYPSLSYTTIPPSAPYPNSHAKHHTESFYPSHSTTPQSAPYPSDHAEHDTKSLYLSSSHSITPQHASHHSSHAEHHTKSSPAYSITPKSAPSLSSYAEHDSKSSYITTPHSVHAEYPTKSSPAHTTTHVQHHKESSSVHSTTPHSDPYISSHYVEHQTHSPSYSTSIPAVQVTSVHEVKHLNSNQHHNVQYTTPALSVLKNIISPESDHEVATNRIHTEITTKPVTVTITTDHPVHLYQPGVKSVDTKEFPYFIRPFYFTFDH